MPSFLHTYEYRVPAERCHTEHRVIRHNPESANRVMMTMTFTEVSEVASEEPGGCPRTGGSPPERIPSSGGACSIGRRSVLRRQEERAPSRGGVGSPENQACRLPAVIARNGGGRRITLPEPDTTTESRNPEASVIELIPLARQKESILFALAYSEFSCLSSIEKAISLLDWLKN